MGRREYEKLEEGVKETKDLWRCWLFAAAMLDAICLVVSAFFAVCAYVHSRCEITWTIIATTHSFSLAVQIWPIADWNDEVIKAWSRIKTTDDNFIRVYAAKEHFSSKPCLMNIAGVLKCSMNITRWKLVNLALSPVVGKLIPMFLTRFVDFAKNVNPEYFV